MLVFPFKSTSACSPLACRKGDPRASPSKPLLAPHGEFLKGLREFALITPETAGAAQNVMSQL